MNLTQPDNSSHSSTFDCTEVSLSNSLVAIFLFVYILLIPPFVYVFLGTFKSRKSSTPTPHSDILTFDCIVFEFINIVSISIFFAGSLVSNMTLVTVGLSTFSIICIGQTMLHVITCIERYVAVVHPTVYIKLKRSEMSSRVIHTSDIFVWMCCCVGAGLVYINKNRMSSVQTYIVLAFCLVVVIYCSLAVLHVLVGHTPGENRHKRRVDPSKKKAFKTIMFILATLLLRLVGIPVRGQLFELNTQQSCLFASMAIWMNLPSSLVLPLLYLQRTGKRQGAKQEAQGR